MIQQHQDELVVEEGENDVIAEKLAEKMQITADSNTKLYEMKITERKRNFHAQLEKNRTYQLELQHEVRYDDLQGSLAVNCLVVE